MVKCDQSQRSLKFSRPPEGSIPALDFFLMKCLKSPSQWSSLLFLRNDIMTSLHSLLPRKTTWQFQPSDCTVTNILQNSQEMETKPEYIHLCTRSSTESTGIQPLSGQGSKDLSLISSTYIKESSLQPIL